MPTKAQGRVAKGLCPQCGKEAAPYYLCYECRQVGRFRRSLHKLEQQGVVTSRREGRGLLWKMNPDAPDKRDTRWETPINYDPDKDKRFRPRLRGVAVDVEAEIVGIFERAGVPLSIDDVVEAWGKLRADGKRKHGSAAKDVRAIILAKRRREDRAARRLSLASPAARTGD